MQSWAWLAVAFLLGGGAGATVTALLRRGNDVEGRMRRMRREYEQYQAEVARHFSRTGEQLTRLRMAFDQLYAEVEERAAELVAEDALQRRLDYLDAPGNEAAENVRGSRPTSGTGGDAPASDAGSHERDARS